MTVDELLNRLDGVRRGTTGWLAKCPAHEDRSPSLSIADRDGVILMRCFAGCELVDVTSAIGLRLSDLFPPRPELDEHGPKQQGRRWKHNPADLLHVLQQEATVLAIIAGDINAGKPVSDQTLDRAWKCREKILAVVDACR